MIARAQNDDEQEESKQHEEAEHRRSPSGKVVYTAVMKEAHEELDRSTSALFWSGLAAGLSMGFSLIAQGVLRRYLPHEHWAVLITKLGYCFGFLVVILGRQQLFTENTLTPVLPLLRHKDRKTFLNLLRLWGVVLASNLLGAIIMGFVLVKTPSFDPQAQQEFIALGHDSMIHTFWPVVLRAIFAGWLIALIVWMLPYAESSHFFVILFLTWLIGVGHFHHIIAGAVNVFALAWAGEKSWGSVWGYFILPTLIGNMIGGITLVAALNHAQVNSGEEG